jgi:hypothetical protein
MCPIYSTPLFPHQYVDLLAKYTNMLDDNILLDILGPFIHRYHKVLEMQDIGVSFWNSKILLHCYRECAGASTFDRKADAGNTKSFLTDKAHMTPQ